MGSLADLGARMSHPRSVLVPGRPLPLGAYPHLKVVGEFVFVSGTSARRPDGAIEGAEVAADGTVSRDIRVQTKAVLDSIATMLGPLGLSLADLVDVTSFLVTMDDFQGYNEVYADYFTAETGPTRTTVAVHQLPDPHLAIEIKGTAYAGRGAAT
jgi:2-aminomuconate deaminase